VTSNDFAALPAPTDTGPDPIAAQYEGLFRDAILQGALTAPRSLQRRIGFSEIGAGCERRLAYRLQHAPRVNHPDPLPSLVGIGGHLALSELFTRRDCGAGRYLIEERVSYRGFSGTVDLYDRLLRLAVDWKFKPVSKIKRIRRGGPSVDYVVQLQLYGAALRERGESVDEVALAFVPVDSSLNDIYIWRTPFDPAVAEAAVARLEALNDKKPAEVTATPSPLCGWCDWHRPGSTNLSIACPGKDSQSE
jgi:hypothetical protein